MRYKSAIFNKIIVEGQKRVLMEKQDFMEMFNDVIKVYGVVKSLLDEIKIEDDDIYFTMIHDTVNLHFDVSVKQQVDEVKKKSVRGFEYGAANDQGHREEIRKFAPDMATWALRYYKIADYLRLITQADQIVTFTQDENPELTDLARRIRTLVVETHNKYLRKLAAVNPKFSEFMIHDAEADEETIRIDKAVDDAINWIKNKLFNHYVGMNVAAIQQYRFTNQWYTEVDTQFQAAEKVWQEEMEKMKSIIPNDLQRGADVIMKFPDNKFWLNLNKASCELEAKAGGHCGNSPAAGTQQRVLSLREPRKMPDGRQGSTPLLTFILHPGGGLGEMKARFNHKPDASLHPYIMALLKTPMITAINGGGYLASNNFSLHDLSEENAIELFKARPDLFPADMANKIKLAMQGTTITNPRDEDRDAPMSESRRRKMTRIVR